MRAVIIFFTYLALVISIEDEDELKVDYYEKLINISIAKAEKYILPKDNSAYFRNASKEKKFFGAFDFIVVGAGSSGSVVASRLSEIEGLKILLLEAGGVYDDLTEIPYLSNALQMSDRNWGYYTTPQKNGCYGSKERKCPYPTGKVLGGSGTLSQLEYVRGNRADYDNWASMGNPGWSFEEVLPYFKKLENFENDDIDLNYRGFAGPVNSVFGNLKENFDILSCSLTEIGMEIGEDYNARKQIGSFRNQVNTQNGRRVSGATAYLKNSTKRHNLNVTVGALVTKILINKVAKLAYGVEFIKDGQIYEANSQREVILCAGAINTPQLLMLSGIGPTEELSKHNIPTIVNLPVGKQLKDHYSIFVTYTDSRTTEYVTLRDAVREYLNGKGILTTPANIVGISFVNTRNASSPIPNVEFLYILGTPLLVYVPFQSNATDEMKEYEKLLCNIFQILILLVHPKSSGTVKLKSNSIIDYPLIDIGIFTDVEDMELLYESIKYITRIGGGTIAKKVKAKLLKYPSCKQYSLTSKEYWFCALKYLTVQGLHASTTAKMAPKTDPFAVVDNNLRVYGITDLRVADCSMMPTPISGHNTAVAYMIGEKAADLVKRDI